MEEEEEEEAPWLFSALIRRRPQGTRPSVYVVHAAAPAEKEHCVRIRQRVSALGIGGEGDRKRQGERVGGGISPKNAFECWVEGGVKTAAATGKVDRVKDREKGTLLLSPF